MKKTAALVIIMFITVICMYGIPAFGQSLVQEDDTEKSINVINGIAQDITNYLWEISEELPEEEYITLMNRNFRIIQAFELLFTEDSYETYSKVYKKKFKRTQSYDDAKKVVEAQSELVQHTSVADGAWFLWGTGKENNANGYAWFTGKVGPVVEGEEKSLTEEALDASEMDGYGQGPVLIKCLLDDPSQAKGNIVLVSGGGYKQRSNFAEGYAGVKCFKALGYNCFLLQRRVAPYSPEDIYMDMQRAIRLVRYYGTREGWGGMDMIAAGGFSGGGRTIIGSIRQAYGFLTPVEEGAADYIPDDIDKVNSDLDAALIAYGNSDGKLYSEENPNWPATFITYGLEDSEGVQNGCMGLYEQIKDSVPSQIFPIADVGHGFGVGQASNVPETVAQWPVLADTFMMEHKGFSENRINES